LGRWAENGSALKEKFVAAGCCACTARRRAPPSDHSSRHRSSSKDCFAQDAYAVARLLAVAAWSLTITAARIRIRCHTKTQRSLDSARGDAKNTALSAKRQRASPQPAASSATVTTKNHHVVLRHLTHAP
jgi:hypothetical protein